MYPLQNPLPLLLVCPLLVAGARQAAQAPPDAAAATANLAVAATVASVRRPGGWGLTWHVAISNDGPGRAEAVVVEAIADESLRPWLANLRIEAGEGSECAAAAMICRIPALPAGATHELRFRAELAATAARRSAGLEFRVAAATQDSAPCDNRYYSTTFLVKPGAG